MKHLADSVMTIWADTITMTRWGRPTEKNDQGLMEDFPMNAIVVRDWQGQGIGIAARATSRGTMFACYLSKGKLMRMIEEIEREEDRIRRESAERRGGG